MKIFNLATFKKYYKKITNSITTNIIILFTSSYIILVFNFYKNLNFSLNVYLSYYLWAFFIVLLLNYILAFISIRLFKIVNIIIIFITSIVSFFEYNYNVILSTNTILAIFNTNKNEAFDFINFKLFLWLTLFNILPFLFLKDINSKIKNGRLFLKLHILSFVFLFTILLNSKMFISKTGDIYGNQQKDITKYFLPFSLGYYTLNYFKLFVWSDLTIYDLSEKYSFSLDKQDQINIVLVIGESARGDHFSLNGYERKTNPLLERVDNLVSFRNFYSCNTGTVLSVVCLMSLEQGEKIRNVDIRSHQNKLSSFISAFNSLGFETYLLNNNKYGKNDPMLKIMQENKQIIYLGEEAQKLDGDLNKYLQETLQNNHKNKLIIIHTIGSHYNYNKRYPKESTKFTPICKGNSIDGCLKDQVINSYDNSILYTDYVLFSFIESLKDTNSLLIYTSDHGQHLGENDLYFHGRPFNKAKEEEKYIPTIIWFSNKWLENFGNKQLLNAKDNENKILNHDYISHSILDCSFISSNIIDKDLSLCR